MKTSNASLNDATVIRITAFLVAFITFITYLPALNNGFVSWDDGLYVYKNLHIQSLDFRFVKWCFTAVVASLWHPLTLISLASDYAVWGLNPFGYHLTNVLFHTANTFLVFVLALRLIECGITQNSKLKTQNFSLIAASITALLFGIHPVHVESVAWISERKDVLSAFFFLLTLISYIKYVSMADSKRFRFYILSIMLFIFALLSKPMVVMLPIVLLILDYYPCKRLTAGEGSRNAKSVIYEKIPFFVLSLLAAVITIWAHHSSGALPTLEKISLGTRILSAMRGYIFYLTKMIMPLDLAPLYPYPANGSVFTFEHIGFSALLLIITYYAFRYAKRGNPFTAAWLYYLITLVPVIGIVQVGAQAAADRYTYLPSLGPFLLISLGISVVFERRYRFTIGSSLILISALLSYKTIKQTAVWQDSMALWSHEIKLYPNAQLAHNNIGLAHLGLGDYRQAIISFSRAIELDLKYSTPYLNRGVAYFKIGNYQQAIRNLDIAIGLNPRFAEAYYNRGLVFSELENYQQAMIAFNKATELNPGYIGVYYKRGSIYNKLGNYQQAIEDYNKAIELDPLDSKTYYNRGNTHSSLGNYDDAIRDYSKAIEIDPRYVKAYNNRGLAFADLGDYRQAIKDYDKVIKFDSGDADAYYNRGIAFKRSGAYHQAIDDFNTAIKLNPDDAAVHYHLGLAYNLLSDLPQSLVHYKKAASLGLKQAQDYLRNQGIAW